MHKYFCYSISIIILVFLTSCGFHLRGTFLVDPALQSLRIISPDPYDPFQRILEIALKNNNICVVDPEDNISVSSKLIIANIVFTERAVAYGSDVQVNRATLQLTIYYQVTDKDNKLIIPNTQIEVERDLTINPNAVLGTESERARVRAELYEDAASQLVRQLSVYRP
jgi:LPS-assembly lipoprotein